MGVTSYPEHSSQDAGSLPGSVKTVLFACLRNDERRVFACTPPATKVRGSTSKVFDGFALISYRVQLQNFKTWKASVRVCIQESTKRIESIACRREQEKIGKTSYERLTWKTTPGLSIVSRVERTRGTCSLVCYNRSKKITRFYSRLKTTNEKKKPKRSVSLSLLKKKEEMRKKAQLKTI